MAQLLAIEWDAREARMAIARTRGKEVTIEHAFAVPLGERAAGASADAVAPKIADALRSLGVGRVETLVAIGRTNLELRLLSVPPAPDDELPEIVRFQAMRQFTTIGEDWPIDFVRLPSAEGEAVSVLAAAISPDVVRQVRGTCEAANLNPKRIVLRPFGAASLLRRHDRGAPQPCRLMVDLLAEEADLSALDGEHLVLTRTVRLGSHEDREASSRALLGEIRRTIAAANNQLGGRRIEKVILCGDGSEHAAMKSQVEQELSLSVELFDPFTEAPLLGSLQSQRPPQAGRFAPLLGLLLDEATGTPHAVDFLHPRKKREKTDTRRRNVLIAATVATCALAAALLCWAQLTSLDDEIEGLRSQSAGMKMELTEAERWRKDAAAIQEFLDHNVNWLDQMAWLSEKLPPADDVLLTKTTFLVKQPNGGELHLEGYTRERTQYHDVEERLRSDGKRVRPGILPNDLKREKYKHGIKETVYISVGSAEAADTRGAAGKSAAAKTAAGDTAGGSSPSALQSKVATKDEKGSSQK